MAGENWDGNLHNSKSTIASYVRVVTFKVMLVRMGMGLGTSVVSSGYGLGRDAHDAIFDLGAVWRWKVGINPLSSKLFIITTIHVYA